MSINKPQRDFAKDRAICEAATPGPWMNDNLSNSLIWGPKGPGFELIAKVNYGILWRDNARFIAKARTGWPAALDEIERLRAALDGIRQYLALIPNKTVSEQRTIEICNEALSTSTGAQQVREPVRWFAEQMEEKLRANDHKPHWSIAHPDYLIHRLFQEVNELWRAMEGELTADEVIKEAADVANFAMMIADNARRINAPEKEGKTE